MVKVAVCPAEIVPLDGVLAMMRLGAVTMTVLVPVASPVSPEVCPCSVARASCEVFIGGAGGLESLVGSFSTLKLTTMRQYLGSGPLLLAGPSNTVPAGMSCTSPVPASGAPIVNPTPAHEE